MSSLKQGDIIKADLNPTLGHEQAGYRPLLVVSNDYTNKVVRDIIKVLPITSTLRNFPLHIPLPDDLITHGMVLVEQEKAIDISYRSYKYIEHVPDEFLDKVINILMLTIKR